MTAKTKMRKAPFYFLGALAGCWVVGLCSSLFNGFGADSPLSLRDYASYLALVALFGFPAALANAALVAWSAKQFHWIRLWQWMLAGLFFGFVLIGGMGWSAHRLLNSIDVPGWLVWPALITIGPMELTSAHAWPLRIALGAAATGAVLYWLAAAATPKLKATKA